MLFLFIIYLGHICPGYGVSVAVRYGRFEGKYGDDWREDTAVAIGPVTSLLSGRSGDDIVVRLGVALPGL